MQVILNYFWQICRLKAGPEQIPNSPFAFAITFAVYFVLAALTLWMNQAPDTGALQLVVSILVGVMLEAIVVLGVLSLKSVRNRFLPTMTALFGVNAIILVVTLPINGMLNEFSEGMTRQLLETLFLAAFFWWVAIAGFIFHRAANISLIQGMVLIFGVEIMSTVITFNLFPAGNA